jgi:hypothetical protein
MDTELPTTRGGGVLAIATEKGAHECAFMDDESMVLAVSETLGLYDGIWTFGRTLNLWTLGGLKDLAVGVVPRWISCRPW